MHIAKNLKKHHNNNLVKKDKDFSRFQRFNNNTLQWFQEVAGISNKIQDLGKNFKIIQTGCLLDIRLKLESRNVEKVFQYRRF